MLPFKTKTTKKSPLYVCRKSNRQFLSKKKRKIDHPLKNKHHTTIKFAVFGHLLTQATE